MEMGWMLNIPAVIPPTCFAAAHTKAERKQACIKSDLFLSLGP
jgi:hypothetical protein